MFDDLRELYQDTILDRSRRPRHGKRPAAYDVAAKGDNPLCGDRCQVFVAHDSDGRLADIGFEARGCAISVASADLMADAVRGLDRAAVRTLAADFAALARTGDGAAPALDPLRPLAGVHEFPSRVKCATLPWDALLAALDGAKEARSE